MVDEKLGMKLANLKKVLETYGSDQRRWPTSARFEFGNFVATNKKARRFVNESAAIDQMICSARRRDDVAALALTERVIQNIERENSDRAKSKVARTLPYITISKRQFLEFAAAAAMVVLVFGAGLSFGTTGWADPIIQQIAGIGDVQENDDPLFNEEIL